MAAHEHVDVDVVADTGAGAELGSLRPHLLEPTVEVTLLHLEFGNAVTQETTDAICALQYHDVVTGSRQLLSGRQPGRPRTHHRHSFAVRSRGTIGSTQPSAHARSMISTSTCLIDTGS